MKYLWLLILFLIPLKVYGTSSYIVMDADSKRVIEGANTQEKKLIASTTKIMTAIIAIENGSLDDKVKIDKDVLKAYGSNIYIEIDEEITLRDLLYGLLLRSGNDAAIEIANCIAGSMDEFVKMMNDKAKNLGMENTTFINSSGLENDEKLGNTSTAYDMALLMSYAIDNKTFVEISGTKRHIGATNYKTYDWHNKNKLLTSYKYTIAGKTGFTKLARRTLVTAALKDDKKLVIVTLHDPNDFDTHKYLYEKNFNKYNKVNILKKGKITIPNNVFYNNLYIAKDINVLLTPTEEKKITINYELEKKSKYEDNEIVGECLIKLDNKIISKVPIYVSKNEDKSNNNSSNKESFLKKILNFFKFWEK